MRSPDVVGSKALLLSLDNKGKAILFEVGPTCFVYGSTLPKSCFKRVFLNSFTFPLLSLMLTVWMNLASMLSTGMPQVLLSTATTKSATSPETYTYCSN